MKFNNLDRVRNGQQDEIENSLKQDIVKVSGQIDIVKEANTNLTLLVDELFEKMQ